MAADPRIEDCVNPRCPFSDKPVQSDSLTFYRGRVVGFCNPACRDKFAADPERYPQAIACFEAL